MKKNIFQITLLLTVALMLPLAASANDLSTSDLIYRPGFLDVPETAPVASWAPPTDFDTKIALSDRSLNFVVSSLLDRSSKSKSGRRLEALSLSTSVEGYLNIDGVFVADANETLPAGRFSFKILTFLHSSKGNAINFDIMEVAVYLQGPTGTTTYSGKDGKPKKVNASIRVFHSTVENPAPVATILDFLAPTLEKNAADQIQAAQDGVHENLAKKFKGVRKPQVGRGGLEQVLELDGNRITLRIIPELFMPVMPPINITYVTVHDRKITLYADFSEGSGH